MILAALLFFAAISPKAQAEALYAQGVAFYESVAKTPGLTVAQKRERIRDGLAALDRAIAIKAEYVEALAYRMLLLREQAKLETDPQKEKALVAEADATRTRAFEIQKRKRVIRVIFNQDDERLFPDDGDEVLLNRAPFTIRVVLLDPTLPVMLNALDSDAVMKRVRPGFRFADDCKPIIAFCPATGLAEEERNPNGRLMLRQDAMHYLYYESPEDHRWSSVELSNTSNIFDRLVTMLDDTPIAKTTMPVLYLTFAVQQNADGVLSEEELRRFKVRFR